MISADQFMETELHTVFAAEQGDVIGHIVAARYGEVRQKNIRPQGVRIPGDTQSRLRRLVGDHIEGCVTKLPPEFVLDGRTEGVVPSAGTRIFIIVERTAS